MPLGSIAVIYDPKDVKSLQVFAEINEGQGVGIEVLYDHMVKSEIKISFLVPK
jgi:hypothetical protein